MLLTLTSTLTLALAFTSTLPPGQGPARGPTETCDTWVALPDATAGGTTILAKNSDRLQFDCQPLLLHPRTTWPEGATIDVGRVSIPQAAVTFATLGSSPYWCWGYEEGVNEYGVAIGNEGVFTRDLAAALAAASKGQGPAPGLTGMDLLRLGLERGRSAREALDVITTHLERFGQFGAGLPVIGLQGAYDNSFLIADPAEAWILETSGHAWVARRVSDGVASISNCLSIRDLGDRASRGLVDHARKRGWWQGDDDRSLSFCEVFEDDSPANRQRRERSRTRAARSLQLLVEKAGRIDSDWMMRIARDSASFPSIDLDQTASSCVAVLPEKPGGLPLFWWCPARPSRSIYVPFFVHGSKLPDCVSRAGQVGRVIAPPETVAADRFAVGSYWWASRKLCDQLNRQPDQLAAVREDFDDLEASFADALPEVMEEATSLLGEGHREDAAQVLDEYTLECVEAASSRVKSWLSALGSGP